MSDLLLLIRHPIKLINQNKGLRYLVAGSVSEAIEYFSFLILISIWPNKIYLFNTLSFGLGVFSGFILHKIWTFRGDHLFKTRQQFIGYISLAAVNFVAINIFLSFYIGLLGFTASIAKLFAIATTVSWTYVITNLFIFRQKTKLVDNNFGQK